MQLPQWKITQALVAGQSPAEFAQAHGVAHVSGGMVFLPSDDGGAVETFNRVEQAFLIQDGVNQKSKRTSQRSRRPNSAGFFQSTPATWPPPRYDNYLIFVSSSGNSSHNYDYGHDNCCFTNSWGSGCCSGGGGLGLGNGKGDGVLAMLFVLFCLALIVGAVICMGYLLQHSAHFLEDITWGESVATNLFKLAAMWVSGGAAVVFGFALLLQVVPLAWGIAPGFLLLTALALGVYAGIISGFLLKQAGKGVEHLLFAHDSMHPYDSRYALTKHERDLLRDKGYSVVMVEEAIRAMAFAALKDIGWVGPWDFAQRVDNRDNGMLRQLRQLKQHIHNLGHDPHTELPTIKVGKLEFDPNEHFVLAQAEPASWHPGVAAQEASQVQGGATFSPLHTLSPSTTGALPVAQPCDGGNAPAGVPIARVTYVTTANETQITEVQLQPSAPPYEPSLPTSMANEFYF